MLPCDPTDQFAKRPDEMTMVFSGQVSATWSANHHTTSTLKSNGPKPTIQET